MMSLKVGDVFRTAAYRGGYRVWIVVGVHLGGTYQESVVRLECLDRTPPTITPICVPIEIIDKAGLERIN